MKKLEQIYNEVASDNIEVAEIPAENYTAYSRANKLVKMIALNPNKISDDTEKLVALYHEYMHIKYGLMYTEDTDSQTIDRMEYKVIKHLHNDLVPKKEILKLYNEGYTISEIADKLEVPVEEVTLAQFLYENIEGYDVNE